MSPLIDFPGMNEVLQQTAVWYLYNILISIKNSNKKQLQRQKMDQGPPPPIWSNIIIKNQSEFSLKRVKIY